MPLNKATLWQPRKTDNDANYVERQEDIERIKHQWRIFVFYYISQYDNDNKINNNYNTAQYQQQQQQK